MVDRKYFEEIGLLDEGMEIYGGENVELGIRVSCRDNPHLISTSVHLLYGSVRANSTYLPPQHALLHILIMLSEHL